MARRKIGPCRQMKTLFGNTSNLQIFSEASLTVIKLMSLIVLVCCVAGCNEKSATMETQTRRYVFVRSQVINRLLFENEIQSHKQLHYRCAKYARGYGGYALSTCTKLLLLRRDCTLSTKVLEVVGEVPEIVFYMLEVENGVRCV